VIDGDQFEPGFPSTCFSAAKQPFPGGVRQHLVISAKRDGIGAAESDFEELCRSHVERARALAHLITGSRSIGHETAQEAMLAVHEAWATLERPEAYLRVVPGGTPGLRRRCRTASIMLR
jgi:hypothetical protein